MRTIKNEDITIPNSIVLGSSVTNYSREADRLGLILHTSVTIGYDAPWRTVHDLLIAAALATPGVLREPIPRQQVGQQLERHVAIEPRVARAIDLAHAARPDGGLNLVRAEARTGGKCHEWPR